MSAQQEKNNDHHDPLLSSIVKSDLDIYRLLSAAVRYDSSFFDESLLMYPLEEGRIYYKKSYEHLHTHIYGSSSSISGGTTSRRGGAAATSASSLQQQSRRIRGNKIPSSPPQDDFSYAIEVLSEYENNNIINKKNAITNVINFARRPISSILALLTARDRYDNNTATNNNNNNNRPIAITPTVLSRLCAYTSSLNNNNNNNSSISTTINIINNNNEDDNLISTTEIKLTGPELVLYTEALRSRAWVQMRRQKRRTNFIRYIIVPIIFWSTLFGLLKKNMIQADDILQNLRYNTTTTTTAAASSLSCDDNVDVYDNDLGFSSSSSSSSPSSSHQKQQQICQYMDATVFPQLVSSSNYYTDPGAFAVHLRLRNETLTWEQVFGTPNSNGNSDGGNNNNNNNNNFNNNQRRHQHQHTTTSFKTSSSLPLLEETVVNQLVRQSILSHSSERFNNNNNNNRKSSSSTKDDENILDLGCGLGSTLYSLVPLIQHRKKNSNSNTNNNNNNRRQQQQRQYYGKTPKLQYTGVALGSLEIENAQRLADQHLSPMTNKQRKEINATFLRTNFVTAAIAAVDAAATGTDGGKEEGKKKKNEKRNMQQQQLFPSETYTAVVALESLSYIDTSSLPKVLDSIHGSLRDDGLFILIDDVVLQNNQDPHYHHHRDHQHNHRRNQQQPSTDVNNAHQKMQQQPPPRQPQQQQFFRQALQRPSIMYHEEWLEAFRAAGFTVLEAKDLTLEYEFIPDDEDDTLFLLHSSSSFLGVWRRKRTNTLGSRLYKRILQFLMKHYKNWLITILESIIPALVNAESVSSWLQLLLLDMGSTTVGRGNVLRKKAYWEAELGYNLYVLKR